MIASGPSVRGLSEVTTTGSASSAATAHEGRLLPSRSPAAAEHTDQPAAVVKSRAVVRIFSRASGVWA